MRNVWIIILFLLPFLGGLYSSCGSKKKVAVSKQPPATEVVEQLSADDEVESAAESALSPVDTTLKKAVESAEEQVSEEQVSEAEAAEEQAAEAEAAEEQVSESLTEEIPWEEPTAEPTAEGKAALEKGEPKEELPPTTKPLTEEQELAKKPLAKADSIKGDSLKGDVLKSDSLKSGALKADTTKLSKPTEEQKRHEPTLVSPTDPDESTSYESRPEVVAEEEDDEDGKVVYSEADVMRPIELGDSTAINMLGNVIIYHNGAIITCDSAVRYSESHMECFGRVIINQNTTYVYGDRASYKGELNEARVYAPLVKIIDGEAVMYTYNCSFNTLTKIGNYSGGATMTHGDNQMESQRGYYYVDNREFVGVDKVELKDPEYEMKSDSAKYNLNTEVATFYTKSYIWNTKGEILSAERGQYSNPTQEYNFTKSAYILTADQELWSDSLQYNSVSEDAILRHNIQIRDEEHHTTGFGDYGEYWGKLQNGMLTNNPSVISYDPQEPDTLYMRADSMFFYSFSIDTVFQTTEGMEPVKKHSADEEEMIMPETDSAELAQMLEDAEAEGGLDRGAAAEAKEQRDPLQETGVNGEPLVEEGESEAESEAVDDDDGKAAEEPKSRAELRRENREAKRAAREQERAEKEAAKAEKESREIDIEEKAVADSLAIESSEMVDSLMRAAGADSLMVDRVENDLLLADSLGVDSLTVDSLAVDSLGQDLPTLATSEGEEKDSMQRVIYGYQDVRIFRTDFQAVCDSLVGFSIDSTMHLYIDPVLWQEQNQITSDIMDIYTKGEEIDRAIFRGSPFMAGKVDSVRYNQIKGKEMKAFFRDNDIYKYDVIGNGQTYYYMQDDKSVDEFGNKELMGFLVAECANMTFRIENREMRTITWYINPVYTIYPMEKIPPTQEEFLPGFTWQEERRPTKDKVFYGRVMRNSEREFYEGLDKPLFPLTESIFKDMERMIKAGIWKDRNEDLSPTAQEFVRAVEMEEIELSR